MEYVALGIWFILLAIVVIAVKRIVKFFTRSNHIEYTYETDGTVKEKE